MKKLILLSTLFVFSLSLINAQSAEETKVLDTVEMLRKAMIDPDKAIFEKIIH